MTFAEWSAWSDHVWSLWHRWYWLGILVSIAVTGSVWPGIAVGCVGLVVTYRATTIAPIEHDGGPW